MSLPSLRSADCDAYLARLGVPSPALDSAGLDHLVAAHLRAVPFHNFFLLANGGKDPGEPDTLDAVHGAIAGLGGTCHLLSPPFATLLRSIGFDAQLVAGDCGMPGDHLLVRVNLGGTVYLADVANGQPYVRAFPVDQGYHEVECYGWRVRFGPLPEPEGGRTHALWRLDAGGSPRRIWSVCLESRTYESFYPIIRAHHVQAQFGPFLRGLRAVRMHREVMLTLRDTLYERHHARVNTRRPVCSIEDVRRLLSGPFGLTDLPVEAAFGTLARTAPERWTGWGLGATSPLRESEAAAEAGGWAASSLDQLVAVARVSLLTDEDPRLLLAMTWTDRPLAWQRLADSLMGEIERFAVPASRWGVLVQDNSATEAGRLAALDICSRLREAGLRVHLDRTRSPRLSIAQSRAALVERLSNWAQAGLDGLPHPGDGEGPVVVWMLDDDVELGPLVLREGRPTRASAFSYAHRIAHLWLHYPEISACLGGVTGAPPIPGHAVLRTAVMDLVHGVAHLSARRPDDPWPPPTNPRHLPDYYYDHSELGKSHLKGAWHWEPRSARTVRDALLEMCNASVHLLAGEAVTRPLCYAGWSDPAPSLACGGNTLFFDIDAIFASQRPEEVIEGLPLRRADTVWAALAAREPGVALAAASVPVFHQRAEAVAGTEAESGDRPPVVRGILAQTWGTVLARLVGSEGEPCVDGAEQLIETRLRRIEEGFRSVRDLIHEFREARWANRRDVWWAADAEVLEGLHHLATVLDVLERRFPLAEPLPRHPVASQVAQAATRLRSLA